jgi:hypothetical protein
VLRRHPTRASGSHAWIFDLLFERESTVTWCAAGDLPAGFERAEQFAVLPAIAGRSFVVSLASRPGTSSALTSYNALRTAPRRLVRNLFSIGLGSGVDWPFVQNKIDIGVASGASAEQLADCLLTEYLRRRLGRGPVMIAFGSGGGPYRKPVLQVFGMDGMPLAYVKVGWNDWTREAVHREVTALRLCASRPMRLGVPELLGHWLWQGLDLLVTAPLPGGVRRLGLNSCLPGAGLIREISQLSPPYVGELGTSPWWQALRTRILDGVADNTVRTQLERVADGIERCFGLATLEFGSWHGDLVPWNMAQLDGRLYAWDWECFAPTAPVGFDALHYYFQVAFIARRRPLAVAAVLARQRARPELAALGVAPGTEDLVAILHLVELFIRHEEARSSAGGLDDRLYPAVAELLGQWLPASPGIAVADPGFPERAA